MLQNLYYDLYTLSIDLLIALLEALGFLNYTSRNFCSAPGALYIDVEVQFLHVFLNCSGEDTRHFYGMDHITALFYILDD